jgi:ribose 5-phosphate isomerase A
VTADEMKKAAAIEALKFVKPGMNVGLGTGSTANHFIEALGQKVKEGLNVKGVPTSKASKELAEKHGIPLTNLDAQPHLDLTVDGTDEFDAEFRLIKGGGGALLFEKIVASSSRIMVVIADESKKVKALGKFPLPVEVMRFGTNATAWKMERAFKILKVDAKMVLRVKDGKPFVTDGGHFIIDCTIGAIPEPERLDALLKSIPGVVETGLFIGICGIVLMGTPKGVKEFKRG